MSSLWNFEESLMDSPTERYPVCRICESADLRAENTRFGLVRCGQCGLVFADRVFSQAMFDDLYARLYSAGGAYQQHLDELAQLRASGVARLCLDKRAVLQRIVGYAPRLVYELGAGVGVVASYFRRKNVAYRGVEFDTRIAAAARQLGFDIVRGDHRMLASFQLPAEAIVGFEVLEHVPDIQECLASIRKALVPGGHLGLSVPNYDKRLNDPANQQIHQHPPPIHLNFWTRQSLVETLRRCGFEPVLTAERRRPYLAWDYPRETTRSLVRYVSGRFHGPVLTCIARRN